MKCAKDGCVISQASLRVTAYSVWQCTISEIIILLQLKHGSQRQELIKQQHSASPFLNWAVVFCYLPRGNTRVVMVRPPRRLKAQGRGLGDGSLNLEPMSISTFDLLFLDKLD